MRNYIQSEEWKDKSQKPVWDMIEKISDDIGAVLTDDIVNYTRNVVDINTCKVPQMIEHAQMLSYGLDNIKNSYEFFPKRIQLLVDLFSINPEYLVGNHQNHILSDEVIKEMLIYVRDNVKDSSLFSQNDAIDRLLVDPHALLDAKVYRNFVQMLFYVSMVEALSATYSEDDTLPIAFNLLWKERKSQRNVLSRLDEYRTWVDKYIWNEIEYPLNDEGLANTLWSQVEMVKNQKQMSSKFNPFKIADHIYFNGLNPNNRLSDDEIDLVRQVLDYHARTRYDYETEQFVDIASTQYGYYKELEFCEYVKLVMFVMNNLKSFNMEGLTYDISINKFIQTGADTNCLRVVNIFNERNQFIVSNGSGKVALNHEILLKVAKFLRDYVFHLQGIRENIKTIAQKHAMRGTGALLVHIVNDYLIKELPVVRDMTMEEADVDLKFGWEVDRQFNNYGNVKVLEYEDDNEYFNIEPTKDVRFTERTNERYWEQLEGMGYDDTLGVLTKGQIKDFYRNILNMGRLQPKKPQDYDDICDFLVDLFKVGANPIAWDSDAGEFNNPIDDIINKSEEDYGYSKSERLAVQTNTDLRKNQEEQFLTYSGNDALIGESLYSLVNNKIFYWKNTDYSSHVLHPFMYNLKLWNKLNNIIINGYKDYVNSDLVDYLTSKTKFDELFGKYGESKNFWKYNVMDLTGYTTRYEAAIKDEHKDDFNNTVSELTGYDGLFYPRAAEEFLDLCNWRPKDGEDGFELKKAFFTNDLAVKDTDKKDDKERKRAYFGSHKFIAAIYSIYWQLNNKDLYGNDYAEGDESFYVKWYSHLNYTRTEYQKIAMQLWYWRDRIVELIRTEYPITKYCLDIQGNSLMLVSTFKEEDEESNPYLIDLAIAYNQLEQERSGNGNKQVSFCGNTLRRPCELWIRWKSNPIAMPAFDALYDRKTSDSEFDTRYRTDASLELGQLTHTNNNSNENFKIVLKKWLDEYEKTIDWKDVDDNALNPNRLPVFFDMEQSANVLALAAWTSFPKLDKDGVPMQDDDGKEMRIFSCWKNPLHILSMERPSTFPSEYNLTEYADNGQVNESGVLQNWMFDSYHYCQATGSILLPFYAFDCSDEDGLRQEVRLRLFLVSAQSLKSENYAAQDRIIRLDDIRDRAPRDDGTAHFGIDINKKVAFSGWDKTKYRFDHPVKVCRNTNMVFSTCDVNGQNRLRCAFLGTFVKDVDENGYTMRSVKTSSCQAKTRYEFDSQSTEDLSLVKGDYFKESDFDGKYVDSNILLGTKGEDEEDPGDDIPPAFNSYDSMDKFVFVLDFQPSIDHKNMFDMSALDGLTCRSYNILSDAGCIPHFAYQSLVKFGDENGKPDRDGGTAYTWTNKYLQNKTHMQFELLGLDDQSIPKLYENMQRMVVDDISDDCKTLLCPAKFMDDIYRIWCENKTKKALKTDDYDSYFANEYVDYPNPKLEFGADGLAEWTVPDSEGFELDLPRELLTVKPGETIDPATIENLDVYKKLLDEYYVSVVRTEDGNILNEKRYLLPPTPISQFVFGVGEVDGYMRCNLSPYQSALVQDDHFVQTQVVFAGTSNPFSYDNNGERIYSKAEELQYGNGICGLQKLELKIDIRGKDANDLPTWDTHGNLVEDDKGPVCVSGKRKWLCPSLRFTKFTKANGTLTERIQARTTEIPAGQITVILSHKNLDNIAKYHILNRSSSLYFDGSLPKNGENRYKYSDFKFGESVRLDFVDGTWVSKETDKDGNPKLEFSQDDVLSANNDGLPPYFIPTEETKHLTNHEDKVPAWFLQQDRWDWKGDAVKTFSPGDKLPLVDEFGSHECEYHLAVVGNTQPVEYSIPEMGNFIFAHKVKAKPEKYLDYLYIKNGGLAFKISEESNSFAEAMEKIPPFHVDVRMRNKMKDLNDVQVLKEQSTFIHQSEEPRKVKDCSSFNPLHVDAILNYGIEQRDELDGVQSFICTESGNPIQLDNISNKTRLRLQLEDGEVDDYLKIYTNYVKVDDGHGDFHFDLYFNIQNLFNSPFEYVSSVTGQPNVLILPDSFLYLDGSKFKQSSDGTRNEIDEKKIERIRNGGELSIYGQVKTYSDDKLSDVRTIKLFTYKVYNISDDKPKFLIDKTYDITKSRIQDGSTNTVRMEFSDVLWKIDEDQFVWREEDEDGNLSYRDDDKFRVLNQDVIVVQPLKIRYNWNKDDDTRIEQIQFDIVNDIIDFDHVPVLCGYSKQDRTLRNWDKGGVPHYDHWTDKYMRLDVNPITGVPRLTLTYGDPAGFNFETIYLRWRLPKGCRIMDTIDRLGGYVFSSTASNPVVKSNSSTTNLKLDISLGHVAVRVKTVGKMYLGLEHSTTKRMNGFVITGLADAIREALEAGERNPTLDEYAISEKDLLATAEELRRHPNDPDI